MLLRNQATVISATHLVLEMRLLQGVDAEQEDP